MIICLDAGHGLNTNGKECLDGTKEWTLNARIADKVFDLLLNNTDIHVLRADDVTGKADVPLGTRVAKANNAKVDYYISIHHNAGIRGGKGGGIVVYYYSSKKEREEQANRLYKRCIDNGGLRGNRWKPVQKANFYVLRKTSAPALLIECGFMDSVVDMPIIQSETYADLIAHAIYDFIREDIRK